MRMELGPTRTAAARLDLPRPARHSFACATSLEKGTILYIDIEAGDGNGSRALTNPDLSRGVGLVQGYF